MAKNLPKTLANDFAIGSFIHHYQVLEKLGQGGMGKVYKVYDTQLRRTVALKILLAGSFATEMDLQRFEREAQATAALKHPNIVSLYEFGREGYLPFFTMDFIAGDSLESLLEKRSLSIRQKVEIVVKICKAIHYAHGQKIIHRDLKPSNVIVGKNLDPKIMDFGLAKVTDASKQISQEGLLLGTLQYMPPEQIDNSHGEIDARSDVYAIGVILYQLLCGKLPYEGNNQINLMYKILEEEPPPLSKINVKIPMGLEIICIKAMSKSKELRYQSAANLAMDLTRFLRGRFLATNAYPKLPLVIITLLVIVIGFLTLFFVTKENGKKPLIASTYHNVLGVNKTSKDFWCQYKVQSQWQETTQAYKPTESIYFYTIHKKCHLVFFFARSETHTLESWIEYGENFAKIADFVKQEKQEKHRSKTQCVVEYKWTKQNQFYISKAYYVLTQKFAYSVTLVSDATNANDLQNYEKYLYTLKVKHVPKIAQVSLHLKNHNISYKYDPTWIAVTSLQNSKTKKFWRTNTSWIEYSFGEAAKNHSKKIKYIVQNWKPARQIKQEDSKIALFIGKSFFYKITNRENKQSHILKAFVGKYNKVDCAIYYVYPESQPKAKKLLEKAMQSIKIKSQ